MTFHTTHHHACDCREQKIAVLIKAALDLCCELGALKTVAPITQEDRERIQSIVERVYTACEEVQA